MNNFTYEEVCFLEVPILREELRNIDLSSGRTDWACMEPLWGAEDPARQTWEKFLPQTLSPILYKSEKQQIQMDKFEINMYYEGWTW